jgi:hypothetical protein
MQTMAITTVIIAPVIISMTIIINMAITTALATDALPPLTLTRSRTKRMMMKQIL